MKAVPGPGKERRPTKPVWNLSSTAVIPLLKLWGYKARLVAVQFGAKFAPKDLAGEMSSVICFAV